MASDRQRRALLRELIEQMRRTNTLTVAMAQSAAEIARTRARVRRA
jgi:hypothetical protein